MAVNVAGKQRATGKTHGLRRQVRQNWYIYVMLLPAILSLIVFSYLPMPGVLLSFEEFSVKAGIFGSKWIGLKNFELLFSFSDFWKALSNTIIISLGRLLFEFPAAIILALLINEVKSGKFRKTVQTVYTFPHFLSWIIVAGILTNMLRLDGLVNAFLTATGIVKSPVGFLSTPGIFRPVLYMTDIWKEAGWSSIIYIAAISAIDEEMYEAALIDGANRLQKMLYITLPCIAGTIAILFILAVGNMLNAGFDQIFNMYNPIVKDVSNILDTYIYDMTFGRAPDYGFSAAIGLFKSVVGLILIIGADRVFQKMTGHGIYSVG
jgi:putative aldouronate transport system permease protein